ncbi:hypothetical protein, partial [Rhodoblastus acidophilus]|uniref:hypothetical protein n=1 Tax=Rhodoblastus acidophilus TaxID=1074 RepID=UPI00222405AE
EICLTRWPRAAALCRLAGIFPCRLLIFRGIADFGAAPARADAVGAFGLGEALDQGEIDV